MSNMPSTSRPKHINNNPRQTFPPFFIPLFPGHAQMCASPLSLKTRSTNQRACDSPASTYGISRGGAKFELQYLTIELPDSRDRQQRSSSGAIRQPPASTHHVSRTGAKIEFQYPTINLPNAEIRRRSNSSGTIRYAPAPTDRALKFKAAAKLELQYPTVNVPGSSPRSSTHSFENVAASFPPASSPAMSFKQSFRGRGLNAGGARLNAVDEAEEGDDRSKQSRVGSLVRKKNVNKDGKGRERDGSGSGSTVSLESTESGG